MTIRNHAEHLVGLRQSLSRFLRFISFENYQKPTKIQTGVNSSAAETVTLVMGFLSLRNMGQERTSGKDVRRRSWRLPCGVARQKGKLME